MTAEWKDYVGILLALALMVAFFASITDHFFSTGNLRTIANQIPVLVIIAVGMTFILISGGIDLSVGSVMALSSAVTGVALVRWESSLPAAIAAGLAAGLACGAMNGLLVAGFRLPSFIVTLGMLEAARGLTYVVTNSQTQYIGLRIEQLASWSVGGIPLPVWLAIVAALGGHIVLNYTLFGRRLLTTGANEEAARLAGIRVRALRFTVFAVCGTLTAVAAMIHTARLSAADPNAGIGLELSAIAAVVIGGTSLSGGRGSVLRSVLGVLVIAVLGSGLAQAGVQEPVKRLVTGGVIVLAVLIDKLRHRGE